LDNSAKVLEEAISCCNLCECVDKPFVKYRVYSTWLPSRVRVLAIGESPPPSKKENFFYNLKLFDRLRLSMKFILGFKENDEKLLTALKEHGIFITAAVKCRPLTRGELSEMSNACAHILKKELELLKPRKVIAMGNVASNMVSKIMNVERPRVEQLKAMEVRGVKVVYMPHPNYVFRFRRNLAEHIKEHILST